MLPAMSLWAAVDRLPHVNSLGEVSPAFRTVLLLVSADKRSHDLLCTQIAAICFSVVVQWAGSLHVTFCTG